jgi:polysaccharide pyruvyl transferase WcaK-like protein
MYENILFNFWSDLHFLLSKKEKGKYVGWNGFGNLGDEVLYCAIHDLLKSRIVLPKAGSHGRLFNSLCHIDSYVYDCLILGGGTLINKQMYLDRALAVSAKRKIAFGCGVSNPEFWMLLPEYIDIRKAWVDLLNGFDLVGVRGPVSKKLLIEWGVEKDISIIGDPVLSFCDASITPKRKEKILGVNLGTSKGMVWGLDEEKVLNDVVRELSILRKRGWRFKFFPVIEGDVDYIRQVAGRLDEHKPVIIADFLNQKSFMEELRTVDVFLGEKLHSVILAACTYTPIVMIEYRPKCRDFMESMDSVKNNVRCDRISPNIIVSLVESEFSVINKRQKALMQKCLVYKDRIEKFALQVREME